MRVVRRTGTHPASPDDGVMVAHGTGITSVSDTGLAGETVYYYTLFPFHGAPPVYDPDPHNQVSAMATAPYDFAGQVYALLPGLYRRYDAGRTPAPGTGLPSDRDKGELRRFLDLPGGEFDRLYSFARAALSLADLDRVEGGCCRCWPAGSAGGPTTGCRSARSATRSASPRGPTRPSAGYPTWTPRSPGSPAGPTAPRSSCTTWRAPTSRSG